MTGQNFCARELDLSPQLHLLLPVPEFHGFL